MKKLLLFDVDGTLIKSGSALTKLHNKSFNYGFKTVYGIDAWTDEMDTIGFTDKRDIYEIMKLRGLSEREISSRMDEMFSSMAKYFKDNLSKINADGVLIEGVKESLSELEKDKGLIIGLLTGNVKGIAEMKLKKLGIWNHFKCGGFGSSSAIRSELVSEAISDAKKKRLIGDIELSYVYVIGDTKRDIECAKEAGAVSVAVASGEFSKDDLEDHKPDFLISSLSELVSILKT